MIDSYQVKCIIGSKLNRIVDTKVEYHETGYSIKFIDVLFDYSIINELKHTLDRFISEDYSIFESDGVIVIKVEFYFK
jgi:hypothetical protein